MCKNIYICMHAAISLSLFFSITYFTIFYIQCLFFFFILRFRFRFVFFVHKNYKRKQMKLFHSVCAQASLFIIHTYIVHRNKYKVGKNIIIIIAVI